MLANLKKKRKFFCECEYLESTGTQYIDTGYKPNTNTRTVGRVRFNSWIGSNADYVFGVFESPNNYGFNVGSARQYFNVPWGTSSGISLNGLAPQTNKDYEFDISKNGYKVNGTSYGTISSQSVNSTRNMYLFWSNGTSASGMNGRIYYLKIYDNGVLVRDMIPVLDWNMTPCMYDRVTEQLFYNQGTGDFVVGRQIHYVDYLESTGTQYINTGLLSTDRSTVDIEFSFTSMESGAANNCAVFGGRDTQTSNTFTFFRLASTTPQYFRFDYNGQTNVGTSEQLTWDTSSKYRFQYNGTNRITTNTTTGESVVAALSPGSTFTKTPICLFAVNTNGTLGQYLSGRIYYYKYSDGTNSVDMVPAIDENGVGFMFDRVTHTIYDNAGQGSFKYPAREIEYLESTGEQYIDTGIQYIQGDTIELNGRFVNPTHDDGLVVMQPWNTPNNSRFMFAIADSGNISSFTMSYNSLPGGSNNPQPRYLDDHFHTWHYEGLTLTIDDGLVSLTNIENYNQGSGTLRLFYRYNGPCATAIKYYKQWRDGNLVRDFIPCYKDGVACMVDKLTGTAYLKQGTGTFTAGKIVEPEYE